MPKTSRGFTLIELLVAISILAILSTVGIVIFKGVTSTARDTKRKGDVEAIAKAYEVKFQGGYGYSALNPDGSDFATGVIPTPPEGDSGGNGGKYFNVVANDHSGFKVCAALENNPSRVCNTPAVNCYCVPPSRGEIAAGTAITGDNSGSGLGGGSSPSCDPNGTLLSGLVGYWKMDDVIDGNTTPDTMNNKNGTLTNGSGGLPPILAPGKFGNALNFSRSNKSKVSISGNNALCPTSSITITGWFYRTETGYNHAIMGDWWGNWGEIWVNNANSKLYWQWIESNGTITHTLWSQTTIALNTEYFFAVTVDKATGTGYLYVNEGNSEDTETSIVDFERGNSCSYASIGATGENEANNPNWFSGWVDDMRIYNRALSAPEITTLYNSGNGCI